MKKSFLFSMALVAALSSCTKEKGMDNYSNDVEIQFGAGVGVEVEEALASRASVDAFDNTNVGMFVLAKNADADYAAQEKRDVLWNNVSATIATGGTSTVNLDGQSKYYPNGGDREFSFYGYHPYDAAEATIAEKNITKDFTINGTQDILWGKAEVEGGYNAAYFRRNEGVVPNVDFKHLLSKLQFKVVASESFEAGQTLKVTGLKIVNVPTAITLDITSGTLTPGTAENEVSVYSNATGIDITEETSQAQTLGEAVMLYSSNDSQAYQIVLTTQDEEGASSETSPIEIKPLTSGNFAVGSAYNVTITLNSNKTIEFTASLTDWVTGEDVNVEI